MCKRLIIAAAALICGILIYKFCSLWTSNLLLMIIRNHIPDYLWVVSFYFISVVFIRDITKRYVLWTTFYVVVISIIYEFLQFFCIVKGTFDVIDILAYIAGVITACIIEKTFWEEV